MLRLWRTLCPLTLIFLLCEADGSCTSDLIIAKSQVWAAYGETVVINCTTPSDDYHDLYLKTDETRSEGEVSVTKWDMKVECVVELEHSLECRQEIDIQVYKTPDSVSVSAGEMQEGAANRLSCDVTNVAPLRALRVKWYRDNETLYTDIFRGTSATPVNVSSTLTITAVKEDSLKHFRCQAELHLGPNGPDLIPTVTSSAFTPVVLYKPTIQGCPGRYTGVEHVFSLDTLPCSVDGNPPPIFHWHYEGVEIDASVPLTRTGSGRYTFEAVNYLGRDSTAVNVTVEYVPSLTCKQFYEIEEGAQDQRVCEVEGVPPPDITWIKDGVAIATPPRWTKDDSGSYSLTATNRHGTDSRVLYLDVVYKPTIQGCPDRYTGVEHVFSLDTLPCGVDGNPPPTFHWYYEGAKVNASVPLTRTGSGRYTAEAVNRLGRDSTAVNVTVEYAPSLTCKQYYEIEEGAQDQSVCEVEGVPPPVMAWIKDGVAIATPPRWTKDDSGNYSLTATNSHGTESDVLYLDVLYKPTIQGCPGRYTGVEHVFSLDRLPCGVDGNPPPTLNWYYEGAKVNASVPLTRTGSGRYTAEAVNRLGRDSTAVNVTVEYAPAFIVNHVDIDVYEGEKVNLSCEADGFPPPQLMWTCIGTNVQKTTKYIIIGQIERSLQCNCTAYNYLHSATKEFNIVVWELSTAAPPAGMTTPDAAPQSVCPVTLSPAEVAVRFGDPLTINCSTSAADARLIGFEVPFGEKQEDQPFSVTWAAEAVREWVVEPLCYVALDGGRCSEVSRIAVYKTPDSVSVSAGEMQEGAANRLSCDVTNVAPLRALVVKWYRGNETLRTEVFNGTSATPVNVSSTLTIAAVKEDSLKHFRCQAELQLGPNGPDLIPTVTSSAFTPVVLYKPTIQGCPGRYTGVEHVFSLDTLPCGVDGNPPTTLNWYFEGSKVNASVPLNRTGSGRYTAEAVNRLGRDSTAVNVTVEYAPSLTCEQYYEIEEGAQDQSVCEVEGVPPPVMAWIKDGVAIATPPRWTRDDSGNYSLTAANSHGTDSRVLYLDVLYGPVFNLDNYAQEVSPGGNVSLECSAEGNPPPEVDWEYAPADNAIAATRGRQKSITITGATSTNAGVYVCVATSKVGRATRSVTLLMKGKTSPVSAQVVGILLFFLFTFLIVILIILCRKCKKKNGEYRFVADRASDGPDTSLPLTTKHEGLQA